MGSVIVDDGGGVENTDEYWVDRASLISCGEVMRVLLTLRGPIPPFTSWCLRAKE